MKYHDNWLKALRVASDRKYEITMLENELKRLQAENAKLRRVIEAAGISVNDAMIIDKHLNELGEGAKWRK